MKLISSRAPGLLILALLAGTACRNEVPGAKVAPGGEHAAVTVIPGSFEDWCGDHAVPESQCTRCNATLIPAFKATNDWCKEHDLPESQCLLCNPNLKITRPAKPTGT